MSLLTRGFSWKKTVPLLLFSLFFSLICFNTALAQVPIEQGDLPIDPNALKNVNLPDLMNYLKDNNQQAQKPGEDIRFVEMKTQLQQLPLKKPENKNRDNLSVY